MGCCVSDYFRKPGCLDFTVKGGVAWHPGIFLYSDEAAMIPVDLTGYVGKMEIRNATPDNTGIFALIKAVPITIINATSGTLSPLLTDTETQTLAQQFPIPMMRYDLNFYNDALPDSFCALSGAFIMDLGYTDV